MSLITCPECGHDKISDKLKMCPYCGYKIHIHRHDFDEKAERKREKLQKKEYERILREHPDIAKDIEEEGIENVRKQLEVAGEYQEKLIRILKKQQIAETKVRIIVMVWSVIWSVVFVWAYSVNEQGSMIFPIVLAILCAVIGWLLLILTNGSVDQMERDIQIATKKIEEFQIIMNTEIDE